MVSDEEIEREMNEKGLNAPKITIESIESIIKNVQYHIFKNSQLTVCCITLENGFTVTGESACASPANFNKEIGEKLAYAEAKTKIWKLEGYLLKQHLYEKELKNGKN